MNNMKKLTAQQILEIVEQNYSVDSFAYGSFSEATDAVKWYTEETKEVCRVYKEAYNNWVNHPGYRNRNQEGSEYKKVRELYSRSIRPYELIKIDVLNGLGLGQVVEVDQYGGEGQGETWYSIKHFIDHDVYIRTDGHYTSYNGTDFEEGYGYEVKPVEKVVTVYEGVKDE